MSRKSKRRLGWGAALIAVLGVLAAGLCLLPIVRADETDGPPTATIEVPSTFALDSNVTPPASMMVTRNAAATSGGCGSCGGCGGCGCGGCCGDDVTFNPNPIITGYQWNASTSAAVPKQVGQDVTATFSPKALAGTANIVVTGAQDRIEDIAPGDLTRDAAAGTIKFKVYGKSMTPVNQPNGDVTLKATNGNTPLNGEAKVIVVIPVSQTRVVGDPFVNNFATPAVGGYTLSSTGGSIVSITFKDQYTHVLDKVYDGHSVVDEDVTGDEQCSGPITVPDDVLANGVKNDMVAKISPNPTPVIALTLNQAMSWMEGSYAILGHTNAFSLFHCNQTHNMTQVLKVWGHPITPDYNRKIVMQFTDAPNMPVQVTDTPK